MFWLVFNDSSIEISSEKFMMLILQDCVNLTITQIDAPNLRSIMLLNNQMPLYSINISYILEVKLEFKLGNHNISMDDLNKLLGKLAQSRVVKWAIFNIQLSILSSLSFFFLFFFIFFFYLPFDVFIVPNFITNFLRKVLFAPLIIIIH
jgi:hypothetical protein